MGTNYYTRVNECKKCGRSDIVHLGKSSGGWVFSFQYNGGLYYKNVTEMRAWLKGKKITDEYGRSVSYREFWKMVKDKQKPDNDVHAALYPGPNEYVIDGYSFSDTEFS